MRFVCKSGDHEDMIFNSSSIISAAMDFYNATGDFPEQIAVMPYSVNRLPEDRMSQRVDELEKEVDELKDKLAQKHQLISAMYHLAKRGITEEKA